MNSKRILIVFLCLSAVLYSAAVAQEAKNNESQPGMEILKIYILILNIYILIIESYI